MATLAGARLLLLDEHLAALDPKTAETVMALTGRLVAERSLTTLMVTHNMQDAIRWGNRLIMMHAGRIILDIARDAKGGAHGADAWWRVPRGGSGHLGGPGAAGNLNDC